MNKEAFDKVIAFMETESLWGNGGYIFDMAACLDKTQCGTACCIGGSALVVSGVDIPETRSLEEAGDFLGLNRDEAFELFYCHNSTHKNSVHEFHQDRPRAIKLLKDIRDGKVVFDHDQCVWQEAAE